MTRTQDTAPKVPDTECPACYRGLVFIGHLVENQDGEEVEIFEPIPCRSCAS